LHLTKELAALQESGTNIRVELFQHIFDPARSIFDKHPLCDYQSTTFITRGRGGIEADGTGVQNDSNTEIIVDDPVVLKEIDQWLQKGLLEVVEDTTSSSGDHVDTKTRKRTNTGKKKTPYRITKVSFGGSGSTENKNNKYKSNKSLKIKQVWLLPDSQRLKAKHVGGMFYIVDELAKEIKEVYQDKIPLHLKLIESMAPQESDASKTSKNTKWILTSINKDKFGPFDLVLMCMDHNPRHTRRAGFKAITEQQLGTKWVRPNDGTSTAITFNPRSSPRVMSCVARSMMCTAMGILIEIYDQRIIDRLKKNFGDSIIVEGIPEVKTAIRRSEVELFKSLDCQFSSPLIALKIGNLFIN